MAETHTKKQTLLVFDFDHTVIDDNVDVSVSKLGPGGVLPEEVKCLYSGNGWIRYMGAVFQYLHQQGVSPKDIQNHVEGLHLSPGMKELFEYMRKVDLFDTIIISDANSVLINYLLKHYGLNSLVSRVFTNPAEYSSDGCLLVSNYHTQDWCSLSTVNLCKGHILQDYIQRRSQEGVLYSCVVYIGDGSNDLCPGLTLRPQDFLMPRKGYSLWDKLEKRRSKSAAGDQAVVAQVIGWDSATEIKKVLETVVKETASKI